MDPLTKMFMHVGVGGLNCPCCAPPPGPDRKRLVRSARRASKRFSIQEGLEEYYQGPQDGFLEGEMELGKD